ncbi:MAG: hypothetical protein AB7D57_10090, partial [Desulfovibrionaceae bacterium]
MRIPSYSLTLAAVTVLGLGGLLGAVVAETGARSVAALGGAVGTVGAAALGVLVWNAQLRRRVRRATSRLGARNAELRRSGE